jgi:hypothetical protein
MTIKVEILAPWTIAVYVDGEIDDCFDCITEAVDHISEIKPDLKPEDVNVVFGEDYDYKWDKGQRRGWSDAYVKEVADDPH